MITAHLAGDGDVIDRWTATDGSKRWTVRYQPSTYFHKWEITGDSGLEVYARSRLARKIRAACRQAVRDQRIQEGVENEARA